jgi:protein-tyrosine phosphatase
MQDSLPKPPTDTSRVLFLCSGNYYRSRFAEILFNWHAERENLNWRADSRGLAVDSRNPGPISTHTLSHLQQLGISTAAGERFPADASNDDFASASLVVAVKEAEHRPMIEARFPQWTSAVEYWHIDDLDCALPCRAIPQLSKQIAKLLDRLAKNDAWFEKSHAGRC